MNTTTTSTHLKRGKSCIKAFLIAVALGFLAAATLSTLENAMPSKTSAHPAAAIQSLWP